MNFSNLSFSFNNKRKSYKNTNLKKNITIVNQSNISNVSTKKHHQPIIIKKPKNISNKNKYISKIEKTNEKKIYSLIPLNVFQTWHTLNLPTNMNNCVNLLKKQNPEFNFYLYDDDMCREFIKSFFHEDILWAFDKLKPGAYKADLWRYCILYIKGGIYLDIKFKCIDNFRLIELTEQEYWVKDRKKDIDGIYQALMVTFPRNDILWKAIQEIVINCKNNSYSFNSLAVSGPSLLGHYFNELDFKNMLLENIGDIIVKNKIPILNHYNEYRSEQKEQQNTKYYDIMWRLVNIYNYSCLKSSISSNISNSFQKKILENNITFYSSNACLFLYNNNKYCIVRYLNYKYNKEGIKTIIPKQWISLNSILTISNSYEKTSEKFEVNNFENELKNNYLGFYGIEDIRIYNFNNQLFYIGSTYCSKRKIVLITSNKFEITNELKFEPNIITPNHYDNSKKIIEKNWNFVEYKNELCIIYNWYPLQIGKINYETNKMNIIEIKYNIPLFFNNIRGSTSGIIYNKEIWFVVHKQQHYTYNNHIYYNYQHCFAVFDLNLNLLRYTELFKINNAKVEFCIGLIIENEKIILSFSCLDSETYINEYEISEINKNIKWFNNELK